MNKIQRKSLYLVTDERFCGQKPLEDVVMAAVRGGVSFVQLRDKMASTETLIEKALRLKSILDPVGIPLLINDRVDVAVAAGADGVHVGQSDMPPTSVRQIMGDRAIIGLSVETLEQAQKAHTLDVDYVAASPVFLTPTKTDTGKAWGLEGLSSLRKATDLPLFAIGGITLSNCAEVLATGIDGIAVVRAIMGAENPEDTARAFRERMAMEAS